MKKSLIFKILYLVLGLVVMAGASVFATNTYLASQVTYGNTNVEQALNELYENISRDKPFVLGSIGTINISGTKWESSSSYSSNEEYMTTSYSDNHIYINVKKEMNIKILLCKTSRGNVHANAMIAINDKVVSTTPLTQKNDSYATNVKDGDKIDIYIGYGDNVKSLGVLVYSF